MKKGNYHRWRGRKYSFILFFSVVFASFCLFIWERNSPFFTLLHSAPYLRVPPSSDFRAQIETHSHDADADADADADVPPDATVVHSAPDVVDSAPDVVDSPPDVVDADAPAKVCTYAKGRWVADGRRPFYSGSGCKQWLSPMWACRLMQRADYSFENYRWAAENCDTPEFGPSAFLERMKDKTIAFVGDSLGRQQFQSLMCMITEGNDMRDVEDVGREYGLVTPPGSRRPNGWAYRFRETNTTVLYYWSSTLCGTDPINSTDPNTDYAMHLDRPPHFLAQNLGRFSVVVLNTGHHWNRGKLNENRWKVYVKGRRNQDRRLERVGDAKSLAVHSVVRWADSQLPAHPGLKVFLRTLSPRHFVGGDWDTGGSCDNTRPLQKGSEVRADDSADPLAQDAVNGTRVTLLDITAISQLRDEGHIAASFSKEKKGGQDCLHWCLPGIPDTWNELLYSLL